MPQQDTSDIREKIISTIRQKGPSLPVHIANATNQSILFASAFLSELLSEKKLKISHMKVGSSPIYFIPGQEYLLEKYSQYLKSKEKEAFILIKEKKFLKDDEQLPAIRVALRTIRDFAIPFKKQDEIYWRYLTVRESDLSLKKEPQLEIKQDLKENEKESNLKKSEETKSEQKVEIFDKPQEILKPKKKTPKKKIVKRKQDNKFFNKVKEFLANQSVEIMDIEGFSKNDLNLIIKENEQTKLLVAYNKKRINEQDIIKASKKAEELNIPYIILSLGEPLKKLSNLILALKKIEKIDKIDN